MSMEFLDAAATRILNLHSDHLERLNIVSPNRRALLFLQKIISEKIERPIWSPRILTIDDLVKDNSPFKRADNLTLNFELFKIWKKSGSKYLSDRFDRFYFWGQILLTDFDDIDKNLVDSEKLFQILIEDKQLELDISLWSDEEKELYKDFFNIFNKGKSNLVSGFENIWEHLGQVYSDFRKHLEVNNMAYNGMMYREVASNLQKFNTLKDEYFIFLGFNRLNACEHKILKHFKDNLQTEFYWNSDEYLVQYRSDDAGKFIANNLRNFGDDLKFSTSMHTDRKKISIIQSPFLSGQSQIIANTVNEIQQEALLDRTETLNETLVLLPNESVLPLLMTSIPNSVSKINISLGLPISSTNTFRLIEAWIKLHAGAMENDGKLYYKEIENLILHPYLSDVFRAFEAAITPLNDEKKQGWNFIKQKINFTYEEILAYDNTLDLFFSKPTAHDIFDRILRIIEWFYNSSEDQKNNTYISDHDKEILAFTHKKFMLLRDIFDTQKDAIELKNLLYLVADIFRSSRLPFRGEPLTGLQILGTMEARNLGFKHVIIPSLEEGYLPAPIRSSFIPFNIRKLFFFPDRTEDAAEQAYYFYSTLQQATNITLIYSQMSDGIGGKEKSRFIHQLLLWQKKHFKNWTIEEKSMAINIKPKEQTFEEIKASPEINGLYSKKMKQGISPSALNDFIDCKLRFYFKHIRNWKEDEELSENMNAAFFGSTLHKAMENIYEDFKNKTVDKQDIDYLISNIDTKLDEALKEITGFDSESFQKGSNYFFRSSLIDYIKSVLEYDKEETPFQHLYHEYSLKENSLKLEGIDEAININGSIDRIDNYNNNELTKIIDYKTGSDDKNFNSLKDLTDETQRSRKKAIFQLLFYIYVISKTGEFNKNFSAELYLLREMNRESKFDGTITKNSKPYNFDHNEMITFDEILIDLFKNILESDSIPKTDRTERCTYCPYSKICKRTA